MRARGAVLSTWTETAAVSMPPLAVRTVRVTRLLASRLTVTAFGQGVTRAAPAFEHVKDTETGVKYQPFRGARAELSCAAKVGFACHVDPDEASISSQVGALFRSG